MGHAQLHNHQPPEATQLKHRSWNLTVQTALHPHLGDGVVVQARQVSLGDVAAVAGLAAGDEVVAVVELVVGVPGHRRQEEKNDKESVVSKCQYQQQLLLGCSR